MIGTLSRRERLLVGGAAVVLGVVGGFTFAVQPVLEHNRATAELVPARAQALEQRRDLVARRQGIAAEVEAAGQRLERAGTRLLASGPPAVAASELQKLVKDMAAQAKTEVRSERILEPRERGELLEIPIEIAVSGEIRQLVDLLARLEAAPKLLTVQDLRVRVVNIAQPRDLLATVTLSGYLLPAKART
jgi:transposase